METPNSSEILPPKFSTPQKVETASKNRIMPQLNGTIVIKILHKDEILHKV